MRYEVYVREVLLASRPVDVSYRSSVCSRYKISDVLLLAKERNGKVGFSMLESPRCNKRARAYGTSSGGNPGKAARIQRYMWLPHFRVKPAAYTWPSSVYVRKESTVGDIRTRTRTKCSRREIQMPRDPIITRARFDNAEKKITVWRQRRREK